MSTSTPGQAVVAWDVGAPADWAALPLEPADGPRGVTARAEIRRVAEELAEGDDAVDRLERFLTVAQPRLLEDQLILLGVWVPDPEAAIPMAVLKAELLLDADAGQFEALVAASGTPEGQERLHLETFRVDLPAGPAVLVDHQGVVDGTVEQFLQFVVFPDGTTDAVSLAFSSTALHLVQELAIAARDIAESLTVTLGDPGDAP